MKKYISFLVASAVAVAANAYQLPDSISTYTTSNADSVIIIQNSEGVTVQVMSTDSQGQKTVTFNQPTDGNMVVSTRLRRSKSSPRLFVSEITKCGDDGSCNGRGGVWDVGVGGLSIGFSKPLDESQQTNIEMAKSIEIGILEALFLRYECPDHKNALEVGFGFNWRNYRTTLSNRFVPTSDGVTIQPYPEGVVPEYSRLKVFSLTVPLLYKLSLPIKSGRYHTGFYIGGILNLNTHASSLTVWRDSYGDIQKVSCNSIYQRKVSVDVLAGINLYGSLSVFVKYSPMTVLERGPQFSSLTTGLMLGL